LFVPNKFLTDYCSFSRRERTGIAALLGLIVLLCFAPDAWEILRKDTETLDTSGLHQTSLLLAAMLKEDTLSARRSYGKDSFYRASRYEKRDGAGTSRFERFEKKGRASRYQDGASRDESNAYRYGARRYEDGSSRFKDGASRFEKYERKPPPTALDINTADTLLWDRLPGIGPVLAKRIVLFRERLGGFYSVSQVGETYGLADSVFVKIQPFLQLGSVSLRKIDLNETDEKSLADHPYIDTKLARTIIRYRSSHGPFSSVEALKAVALVDEVIYRKLEKYLVVK
jgi:DNA uptake protein ComE-like DNA-binding protein